MRATITLIPEAVAEEDRKHFTHLFGAETFTGDVDADRHGDWRLDLHTQPMDTVTRILLDAGVQTERDKVIAEAVWIIYYSDYMLPKDGVTVTPLAVQP